MTNDGQIYNLIVVIYSVYWPIIGHKIWRHTIQMTNDGTVYILLLVIYNVY